jgi:hypothetical protein
MQINKIGSRLLLIVSIGLILCGITTAQIAAAPAAEVPSSIEESVSIDPGLPGLCTQLKFFWVRQPVRWDGVGEICNMFSSCSPAPALSIRNCTYRAWNHIRCQHRITCNVYYTRANGKVGTYQGAYYVDSAHLFPK